MNAETTIPKTEVTRLDIRANSFYANGHKYLILGSIPVGRFERFESLQVQLAWGVDFEPLHKNLRALWDLNNKLKFAEASVLLNNILEGLARPLDGREHPVLLLCSLFLVREGEDLSGWNETFAHEKILDWKAEAISVEDFFVLAFNSVRGLSGNYLAALENTSENPTQSDPESPQD